MTATAKAQSFTPEERREYIGASEIAAVLGLDRWKTPLDVYNQKLGLVPPFEGNAHTERGTRLEAIAAEEYTAITGKRLRRRNEELVHPEYPFIRGHVDRVVVGEQRIVEIKAPSVAAFRKFQREGLPDSFILQAQVYMGLTGYETLTWAIFCADMWDLAAFDIAFDRGQYDAAVQFAASFWLKHVVPGIPPEIAPLDKPNLEFEKIGGDVVRRDDPEFAEAARLLREADLIKTDAAELFEAAKAKVLQAIGDKPGRYEGAGLRLSYTPTAGRRTFDQKRLSAANPELDLEPFFNTGKPSMRFTPSFIAE
jgi:putative phage-type endonuclease